MTLLRSEENVQRALKNCGAFVSPTIPRVTVKRGNVFRITESINKLVHARQWLRIPHRGFNKPSIIDTK